MKTFNEFLPKTNTEWETTARCAKCRRKLGKNHKLYPTYQGTPYKLVSLPQETLKEPMRYVPVGAICAKRLNNAYVDGE